MEHPEISSLLQNDGIMKNMQYLETESDISNQQYSADSAVLVWKWKGGEGEP